MRSLALLRVLVGPVALLHLRPFVADALHGTIYRDAFYEPYASWYPELPRPLYGALLAVGVVAAVAMSLGFCTRVATGATFGVVAYNMFLSTTHVHSNRAYLVIVLAALTVAPCGRELSVDAWLRARRGRPALDPLAPAWPLWLLRFEAAVVYGASGMSKLVDPDWFGGTVTWHRVVQVRDRLDASPLPGWAVSLLADRSFHTVAAKVIVLTELFIAVGLWLRATRYAAVWVAVCFHVAIQVSASVEVFSYLAIAALVVWAVPSTRDRLVVIDPENRQRRALVPVIGALDWLARFRIVEGTRGSPVTLIDRDGTVSSGAPAVACVLSRLPLTAWFALPTLLLPGVRHARRPESPEKAGAPGTASAPTSQASPPAGHADHGPQRGSAAGTRGHRRARRRGHRRRSVRGAVTARALSPGGRGRAAGIGHRDGRLVHPQPAPRRHLALPLRRRRRHGVPATTTSSATPGPSWASTRRRPPASPARWTAPTGASTWALDRLIERDDWAAPRYERRALVRGDRAARRRPGRATRLTPATTATTTLHGPARPVPGGPDRAVRRGARLLRHGRRAPGAGRVLEVLHGRGVLGAGPAAPPVPRRALGRSGRPHRRLPGHAARRRRGPTGHRSPTTGPPTGWQRRSRSPTGPTIGRSPTTSWPMPVGRRVCSARRCGGSASGSGRGALLVRGPHVPRGGGYGVVGEGLTGLWRVGRRRPPPRRPARPAWRTGDLHRRAGGARAVRRRRGPRLRRARTGAGGLVPRRRDADGRPAARPRRAAAHGRHRRRLGCR